MALQISLFKKRTESIIKKSEKIKIALLSTILMLSICATVCGHSYAAATNSANLRFNTGDPGDDDTAPSTGQVENTAVALQEMIIGIIATEDPDTGEITVHGDPQNGGFAKIASATGLMYLEGPVSTQQYLAYLSKKANFGPQAAYAQEGIQGFDILTPIVSLWEWTRNVVYVFYVVIFIVIGIMIIMRQRIGGQIPITIINSIPNVLVSLVLVTFSYAISGLILDLMHLATGIIHAGLFTGSGPGAGIEGAPTNFSFQSPEMSVFRIFGTAQITEFTAAFNIEDIDGVTGGWMINTIINILEDVAQWNVLVSVVLSIAGVTAMFKLFFTLLTNYLTFMLYPILAPIQFLLGSLPGKTNVIWDWFRKMFSAVGAFVGVYLAFCIMIILTQSTEVAGWEWFPPMSGFSASTETIRHLLGYALFIATPNLPGMIEQMFKSQATPLFSQVGGETQKALSKVPLIGGLMG